MNQYFRLSYEKIDIYLANNLEDRPYQYPYTDGEIHLFTNPRRQIYDFSDGITHELIHKLRDPIVKAHDLNDDWEKGFLLVEEGYAGWLTLELDQRPSFPFYGAKPESFVRSLLDKDYYIPLSLLSLKWRVIFRDCSVQGYAIAISFFRFLANRFGAKKVHQFAANVESFSLQKWKVSFGFSLDELENMYIQSLSVDNVEVISEVWPNWQNTFCNKKKWMKL